MPCSLPAHVFQLVLSFLGPRDLIVLMYTCRQMRDACVAAPLWKGLRERAFLDPPKPRARKLRTEYLCFMSKCCRRCYGELAVRSGFCASCRFGPRSDGSINYFEYRQNEKKRSQRHLALAQQRFETASSNARRAGEQLEARLAIDLW